MLFLLRNSGSRSSEEIGIFNYEYEPTQTKIQYAFFKNENPFAKQPRFEPRAFWVWHLDLKMC